MPKLVIKGDRKYISYLKEHLEKEHPSTKKRMRVFLKGGEKMPCKYRKKGGENMKARVKGYLRKVKGRKTKVRVRGHLRKK